MVVDLVVVKTARANSAAKQTTNPPSPSFQPLFEAMSAPSPPSFLLLLLLSLLAAAGSSVAGTAGDGRGPLVGGYQPIKDVNDPHIKEIGRYAVSEYDRKSGQSLDFVRVVSGKQQVVAGMNYDIVVEARNGGGGALGQYEAVVYERAWEHYRDLTSFKPRA